MNVTAHAERAVAGLADLESLFLQAVGQGLKAGVATAESVAKSTPKWRDRTGETRGSIRATYGVRTGKVVAGGASLFLENGTRAHVIRGNPLLRFVVNGETVFRRMVRHPGTRATHFMQDAKIAGEAAARLHVEHYVSEAVRRAR